MIYNGARVPFRFGLRRLGRRSLPLNLPMTRLYQDASNPGWENEIVCFWTTAGVGGQVGAICSWGNFTLALTFAAHVV